MDYDADNECIIGFNDDGNENYMITASFDSNKVNLSPISLPVELCGDSLWQLHKNKKLRDKQLKKQKEARSKSKSKSSSSSSSRPYIYTNNNTKNLRLEMKVDPISPYTSNNKYGYNMTMAPQQHPRTPSPVSPQSPAIHNGYHYNNINYNHTPTTPGQQSNNGAFPQFQPQQYVQTQQQRQQRQDVIYKTGTDLFDLRSKHRGLTFGSTADGDSNNGINQSNADTVTRSDKHNGSRYETYGIQVIGSESYSWKFILHDKTSMIVGLINAEINGQQTLNHYFDTENKIMSDYLYKNGKPKEGIVIEIMYNVRDKCMIVKNICSDSKDFGNSFIFKENIDTTKKYRLSVLLDKPGTVTMF